MTVVEQGRPHSGSPGRTSSAGTRVRDVAELTTSLATRLPPQRVVATADAALGDAAVAQADRAAGVPLTAPRAPARMALRSILSLAGLGFATYVLLPQVGQAGPTFTAVGKARWGWLLAVAAAAAFTYLMAAVALMAASPTRLALGRTWAVQVAAAFTNRLAPAGLGGMRTNLHYLQAAGTDGASAATAVALNSAAGFLVHAAGMVVILPLLGAAGGAQRLPSAPELPDLWPVVLPALAVLVATGVARWGRWLRKRLAPGLRAAAANIRGLSREPRRAMALLAGSAGVTAGYALALMAAVDAFGGGVPAIEVVAVYLGGSALAAVSPTPGGLGATEAALVAGLTGVGAAPGPAVAAVLVYRLITYWAPVLPGLVLFRRLRARGVL